MKKIFIFLMLGIGMMLTSCKTEMGLAYNVAVTGDGDGLIDVQFPQGNFEMNGTATINFYAADTVPFVKAEYLTKQQVLESGNKKYVAALDYVQAELEKVNATDASGTYDLLIDGEVLIYPFNIAVNVHKRLSNRDNVPNRAAQWEKATDRWCYIE